MYARELGWRRWKELARMLGSSAGGERGGAGIGARATVERTGFRRSSRRFFSLSRVWVARSLLHLWVAEGGIPKIGIVFRSSGGRFFAFTTHFRFGVLDGASVEVSLTAAILMC